MNITRRYETRHVVDLCVWDENPIERQGEPLDDLIASIKYWGAVLKPIMCMDDPARLGELIVIDGNRRLRAAKSIPLEKIDLYVIQSDHPLDPIQVALTINSQAKRWMGKAVARMVGNDASRVDVLPTRARSDFAYLSKILPDASERSRYLAGFSPSLVNSIRHFTNTCLPLTGADSVSQARMVVRYVMAVPGSVNDLSTLRKHAKAGRPLDRERLLQHIRDQSPIDFGIMR